MTAILNTIQLIESNWLNIAFIVILLYIGIRKFLSFFKMNDNQKVEIVLKLIKEEILVYMSEAEIDWKDFAKSGETKRSQVIAKIYDKFPILTKYINQEELIAKIDEMIDEEKVKLDKIMNNTNVIQENKE